MKYARMILSLTVVILAFGAVACGESAEKPVSAAVVDETAADVQDAAETAADDVAETSGDAAAEVEDGVAEVEGATGSAMESGAEMADEIKDELAAKEAELAKVSEQIKQLSPQDLLTDNGKELQAKADSLMAEIKDLKGKL